jgi:hypothetical protein
MVDLLETLAALLTPDVAERALALVPHLAHAQMNGQPAQAWLVQTAATLDGWVCGSLARRFLRFDAIQCPAARAHELAERIAAAFPGTLDTPPTLNTAVAEAWLSPRAHDSIWGR